MDSDEATSPSTADDLVARDQARDRGTGLLRFPLVVVGLELDPPAHDPAGRVELP